MLNNHRDFGVESFLLSKQTNFLTNNRFSTFEPNWFEHGKKRYDYKTVPGCCRPYV